ncbi:MAG: porin [Geobacteraceae bacterium]
MKKRIASAVLLTFALAGQNVSAKSLEDVLKEKGVITEEDYKSVIKSSPISYKPGDGFTFLSPDEKFKLSIGGRLQARYSFTDNDDANGGVSDASDWRIRRMKMWMKGHAYSKDLTYKMQVNFVDGGSAKLLEDAYLDYKLIDEFQILVGQDKVPFARQELTSSGAQQFVDRSNATDTFKPGRDAGAMLHGKIAKGLVDYNFGWYGGGGQSTFRDKTNDNAIAARLVVNPLGEMKYSEGDLDYSENPLVSFGVDYYRNKFVKDETNNTSLYGKWLSKGALFAAKEKIEVNTASADLAFKWLGASVQAEYFWAQADGNIAPEKTQRAQGFYAQAGYFVIPKHLELAARYSYVDSDRDKSLNLQTETQGAVSYYFNKHNLKLQGDITNIHKQNGAGKSATDDLQCRLQAQIIF